MRSIRIGGSGVALPERIVTSEQLESQMNLPDGWIVRKTGIRARRYSSGPKESAAILGASACRQALMEAGRSIDEIDYLISAAGTMQQPIPCNAAMILGELSGHATPGAFDVNATCLGFVQALDLAASYIATGQARKILIVCSEVASPGINPQDPDSGALFGDGAAAFVVETAEPDTSNRMILLASGLKTYAVGTASCRVEGGGSALPGHAYTPAIREQYLFKMDGVRLHKMASQALPHFISGLLRKASLTVRDLSVVVPHQAGELPLRLISKRLGLRWEQMVVILEEVGNTLAASIPMALHHARTSGRWQPGTHAMLVGTSAGVSIGGIVLRIES